MDIWYLKTYLCHMKPDRGNALANVLMLFLFVPFKQKHFFLLTELPFWMWASLLMHAFGGGYMCNFRFSSAVWLQN